MKHKILLLFFCLLLAVGSAYAEEAVVQMHLTGTAGAGDKIGTIRASDSPYGTLFTPDLKGLAPACTDFMFIKIQVGSPGERRPDGAGAGGRWTL